MNKKRIISLLTALSMVISGAVVLAQEDASQEIFEADNGYEITEILDGLTDEQAQELGIDLTEYNKITYKKYIGNEIYEAQPTDAAELKSAFDTAVENAIKTVAVNYEIGASFNDTGSGQNNNTIYNGLNFLEINLSNGMYGTSSYFIYHLDMPSAIVGVKAQITGENTNADRDTYISGYSTTEPPFVGSVYGKYDPTTEQYSKWAGYTANSFTDYKSPVFRFKTSNICENDISGILDGLNDISSDTTPFVLRVSKPSDGTKLANQGITGIKLTLTYDNTVIWENQCSTEPADKATEVPGINEITFDWTKEIDTATWNDTNVSVYANGIKQNITTDYDSALSTKIILDELKYNSDYYITVKNIKDADENDLHSRTLFFTTARSYDRIYFENSAVMLKGENTLTVSGETEDGLTAEITPEYSSLKNNTITDGKIIFADYGTDVITAQYESVTGETLKANQYVIVPAKQVTAENVTAGEAVLSADYENYVAVASFTDDSTSEFAVSISGATVSATEGEYTVNGEKSGILRDDKTHTVIFEDDVDNINVYIDGELVKTVAKEEGQSFNVTGELTIDSLAIYRTNDSKPVISGLTVTGANANGTADLGVTLTADFICSDADGDGTESEYGWYSSNSANGAYTKINSEKTITITNNDIGKYFRFEATPQNAISTGQTVKSASFKAVLSASMEEIIQKINSADVYEMEKLMETYGEIIGIDKHTSNDYYIYAQLLNTEFKTPGEFKTAYENAYNELVFEKQYNPDFTASFNDTGDFLNGTSIYNGLHFTTNMPNGFYGSSSYSGFTVENPVAVNDMTLTITGTNSGTRFAYVTGYSLTAPPYIEKDSTKIDYGTDKFNIWKAYVDGSFKAVANDILIANSGVITVPMAPEMINDLSAQKTSESAFVTRYSKSQTQTMSNQNLSNPLLNVKYDLTQKNNICDVEPTNFAKGVNPEGFEYKLVFDGAVTGVGNVVLTDVATGEQIVPSSDINGNTVTFTTEDELNQGSLYMVNIADVSFGESNIADSLTYYFTTDSILDSIDVYGKLNLAVGESSELTYSGYTSNGEKAAISEPELSTEDADIIEIDGNQITAKKRGTAIIKAVYNNFDGSKTEKDIMAIVGVNKWSDSFEASVDSSSDVAYKGIKSALISEEKTLKTDIDGYITVYFYDDLSTNGGVYFIKGSGKSFVGCIDADKYTGGIARSKGWHQVVGMENGEIYIDGVKVLTSEFDSISVQGTYFDEASVTDVLGTVCTATHVVVRGANESTTSANTKATLSVEYSYNDSDNDAEDGTEIAWYYSSTSNGSYTKITGATSKTFKPSSYSGKYIKASVTPKNIYDIGETYYSDAIQIKKVTQMTGGGGGGSSSGGMTVNIPSVTPAPTAKPEVTYAFDDVSSEHWVYAYVSELKHLSVVNGKDGNKFLPENDITRAEFIKMLVTAVGISEAEYQNEFTDITSNDWYAGYVKAALENNIASGFDGRFNPNANITREEMAKMAVAAYELKKGMLENSNASTFADDNAISEWAKEYVYKAAEIGMINGMSDNTFMGRNNSTRAQAAAVVSRLISAIQ